MLRHSYIFQMGIDGALIQLRATSLTGNSEASSERTNSFLIQSTNPKREVKSSGFHSLTIDSALTLVFALSSSKWPLLARLSTTPKTLQDILSNHCPMRNQQRWLSQRIRWVDCLHMETRVRKNKGCEEDTQEIHHGPRGLLGFNAFSHTSWAAASLLLCGWNFSGKASDHTHQSGSPHSSGGNGAHLPTLSFRLEYKVFLQKSQRLKAWSSGSGTVENGWVLIS